LVGISVRDVLQFNYDGSGCEHLAQTVGDRLCAVSRLATTRAFRERFARFSCLRLDHLFLSFRPACARNTHGLADAVRSFILARALRLFGSDQFAFPFLFLQHNFRYISVVHGHRIAPKFAMGPVVSSAMGFLDRQHDSVLARRGPRRFLNSSF
jgi:hypothetical protein